MLGERESGSEKILTLEKNLSEENYCAKRMKMEGKGKERRNAHASNVNFSVTMHSITGCIMTLCGKKKKKRKRKRNKAKRVKMNKNKRL